MVWYYVKDGARQGPVEEVELNSLVGQGVVLPDTLVWSEGMSDWRPYGSVMPAATAAAVPAAVEPVQPQIEAQPAYADEPAPQTAPETSYAAVATPLAAATAAAVQPHYCTQCGRQYPSEELVRFGTATVCANCKDIYAQRLRETGQVAGTRIYGGFWIRFLAVFIDGILLGVVNFALQAVTSTRMITGSDVGNLGLILSTLGFNFAISITLNMLYESFFLVQYGATPGKMIFKLKVITAEGGRLTWGRAIGRFFAKFLSGITLLIGYIMAAFDSEKRALHDYIAGTRVIRTA